MDKAREMLDPYVVQIKVNWCDRFMDISGAIFDIHPTKSCAVNVFNKIFDSSVFCARMQGDLDSEILEAEVCLEVFS